MMKTGAVIGIPDVHPGALSNRFKPLEDAYRRRVIQRIDGRSCGHGFCPE
jgi:hypothetical protein